MSKALSAEPKIRALLESWERADPAAGPLLERLRSDSIITRTTAAEEAAKKGAEGKAAALALVECLEWRPERPRGGRLEIMRWNKAVGGLVSASGSALARIGQPAVAVLETILNSSDKALAANGAFLRDVRDPDSVAALITCLSSPNVAVRSCAAQALGAIANPKASAALAAGLRDDSDEVRQAAAQALRRIGDQAALQHLVDALEDPKEETRKAGCELGNVKDKEAADFLIAALSSNAGLVVEQAAIALGRIRDQKSTAALLRTVIHPWPAANVAALKALKSVNPKWPESSEARAAEAQWIEALGSTDGTVRSHAAAALGIRPCSAAMNALMGAIKKESNPGGRAQMAAALGSIGDPQAVDTLLEVVAAETDDVARVQLVIALAELGDSDAVEPLTALIEPEDKPSRRLVDVVVGALGSLGDPRGVPALIDVLTAQRFGVPASQAAAHALGKIGGEQAISALNAVQEKHWSDGTRASGFVARAAQEALGNLPS